MYEDPVQMQYKKPLPDEGDPKPSAQQFEVAESGPVGKDKGGPEDYDIEFDEVVVRVLVIYHLMFQKLKEYATGQRTYYERNRYRLKKKR